MDYPEQPELIAALQATHDIYGDEGIDHYLGQLEGYPAGEESTAPLIWGGPGSQGERVYWPLHDLTRDVADDIQSQLPTCIICVEGMPAADGDAELQRQANIRYWFARKTVAQLGGADLNRDGVTDRLTRPRQAVSYPGNGWPDFIPAQEWVDPSKSPAIGERAGGTRVAPNVMVFKNPEAAVESTRLVIAALENGGVTPG